MNFIKKFIESVKADIPKDPKLIRREIKNYTVITLCLALYTFSVIAFVVRSNIVGGGVSGIATLIYYATGHTIPVSVSSFIINAVLLLIGIKILGKGFGMKTIFAVVVSALFMGLWEAVITKPILADDLFLSAVVGGLLIGVAIGTSFTHGGSTGGTDIIALIIAKYRNIGPGKIIMFCDIVIIGSSFFVSRYAQGESAENAMKIVIYGFVLMGIYSYVIDQVVLGGRASVQIMVNSTQHKEIAEMITHEKHHGVTLLHGQKYYTQTETEVLWIVVRKYEMQSILRRIKDIDPDAFMSITNASGVYGKGFEQVK